MLTQLLTMTTTHKFPSLDAGLVDAADAVGLRLEGHQLGVLLDHKDEVGLTLKEYFLIIIFPKTINFSD